MSGNRAWLATSVATLLCATAVLLTAGPALADYPDDCFGSGEPSASDCAAIDGLTYEGCCDQDGKVVWCDFDGLYCIDCAGLNPECGWISAGFYDCGTVGDEEPSGNFPKDCAGCDPKCGPGFKCVQGQCEVCTPQCEGKQCGKDGCGGTCGTCEGQLICTPMGTCVEVPLCQVAGAFHCDETHSGTTVDAPNMLQDYPCYWDFLNGGEVGYSFSAFSDDTLFIDFEPADPWADMNLLVLTDSCAEQSCQDWFWTGQTLLDVKAGTTYYFVIDSYAGGEGEFDLSLKCQSTCVADCEGKQCGDDGCFGTCGECFEGACMDGLCMTGPGCVEGDGPGCGGCPCETCVCDMDSYCCNNYWDGICVDECIDYCGGCATLENCGDSVCQTEEFESCGNCPADCVCAAGETCFNGKCCHPNCTGVECGDDGCGGSCGDCPEDLACIANTCQANDGCYETTTPGCPGCICETCACDIYPPCCTDMWDSLCVMFCDEFCEGCGLMLNCGDGICQPQEFETCSNCPGDCQCAEGQVCLYQECCTPSCEFVQCGDDGCGGDCGGCPDGLFCSWGECVEGGGGCMESNFPGCGGCACEECVCMMDSWCCEVSWDSICVGECEFDCGGCGTGPGMCGDGNCADTPNENCGNCPQDCPCAAGEVCMWDTCCAPDCDGMECGDNGCGGTCGTCDDGCTCTAQGQCVGECGCIPDCNGKECGPDGCGAECGECSKGDTCNDSGLCEVICPPSCKDKECGDDGCGGSCGDCPEGELCIPGGICQAQQSEPAADAMTVEAAEAIEDVSGSDVQVPGTDSGMPPDGSPDTADPSDTGTADGSGGCSGCTTTVPRSPMPALVLVCLLMLGRALLRRTAPSAGS